MDGEYHYPNCRNSTKLIEIYQIAQKNMIRGSTIGIDVCAVRIGH